MSERKYVILQDRETGKEYPVVFHCDLAHKSVAEGIMRETRRSEWGRHMYLEPVAAGFVGDAKRASESLGIGPRPQDTSLLGLGASTPPKYPSDEERARRRAGPLSPKLGPL